MKASVFLADPSHPITVLHVFPSLHSGISQIKQDVCYASISTSVLFPTFCIQTLSWTSLMMASSVGIAGHQQLLLKHYRLPGVLLLLFSARRQQKTLWCIPKWSSHPTPLPATVCVAFCWIRVSNFGRLRCQNADWRINIVWKELHFSPLRWQPLSWRSPWQNSHLFARVCTYVKSSNRADSNKNNALVWKTGRLDLRLRNRK